MNIFKSVLLHAYYHGSRPYRCWQRARAISEHRCPVTILFYHRVADYGPNDWTMSNRTFVRQIDWLRENFDIVSLGEAQNRIRTSDSTRPCVSITFDDGYADNCSQAMPYLIKSQVPCTYFVTLGNLVSGEPFPHDTARGDSFPPNNLDQLKAMAAAGIEIGAHTRTHCDLGAVTDHEQLHDEVVTSGEELQRLVGNPVRYFAFPFGQYANLNPAAFQMAYDAGYEAVCSAYGGYNFPGDDAYHLQRIHADDDMIRIKNRATIDPRKLNVRRYEYQQPADPNRLAVERGKA
jgi:peptidoglycan/xylan/chitin deacetylase (PgdA/CDA1 family)